MNSQSDNELAGVLFGALTAATVGSALLQALGAVILGILGAAGGYLCTHVLIPKLVSYFKKNKKKAG